MEFVLNAFEDKQFPKEMNETLIILIPKQDTPRTVAQFRLIALCNVAIKCITKIITSRLKPIMAKLVDEM